MRTQPVLFSSNGKWFIRYHSGAIVETDDDYVKRLSMFRERLEQAIKNTRHCISRRGFPEQPGEGNPKLRVLWEHLKADATKNPHEPMAHFRKLYADALRAKLRERGVTKFRAKRFKQAAARANEGNVK